MSTTQDNYYDPSNPIAYSNTAYIRQRDYYVSGAQHPPRNMFTHERSLTDRRLLYRRGTLLYTRPPQRQFNLPSEASQQAIRTNSYRKVAKFWVDMLYAEPPNMRVSNTSVQDFIGRHRDNVVRVMMLAGIGATVEGVGIVVSLNPGEVGFVNACNWYPGVDAGNQEAIVQHNLVYPFIEGDVEAPNRVKVVTIEGTRLESRVFSYEGNNLDGSAFEIDTRTVPENAVVAVYHEASESLYGESGYIDMYPLVEELNRRFQKNSNVLEKHSDPNMQVPASTLNGEDGEQQTIPLGDGEGKAIAVNEGDPDVKYVTFDGKLEASFEQIDKMKNELFEVTALSPAIFGDMQNLGTADSGAALKRLTLPTTQRLKKLRRYHEEAIRSLYTALGGWEGVSPNDLAEMEITWNEPFRESDSEVVETEIAKLGADLIAS